MYLIATCKQGLYGHTGIHAYTLVSKVPLPLVLILANVYLQDIHEMHRTGKKTNNFYDGMTYNST